MNLKYFSDFEIFQWFWNTLESLKYFNNFEIVYIEKKNCLGWGTWAASAFGIGKRTAWSPCWLFSSSRPPGYRWRGCKDPRISRARRWWWRRWETLVLRRDLLGHAKESNKVVMKKVRDTSVEAWLVGSR